MNETTVWNLPKAPGPSLSSAMSLRVSEILLRYSSSILAMFWPSCVEARRIRFSSSFLQCSYTMARVWSNPEINISTINTICPLVEHIQSPKNIPSYQVVFTRVFKIFIVQNRKFIFLPKNMMWSISGRWADQSISKPSSTRSDRNITAMLLLQGERTCSTTLVKLTHEQQCYSYRENTTYHYTMNQFMHTGKFDVHCNMCTSESTLPVKARSWMKTLRQKIREGSKVSPVCRHG